MPKQALSCLDHCVEISYESLARYLTDFEVDPSLVSLPNSDDLSVELRLAIFRTRQVPITRYLLVFAFDKGKKNRLVLVNPSVIDEVSSYLTSQGMVDDEGWIMLVGKEGSRVANQLNVAFQNIRVKKLVVLDFGKTPLVDFLREVASDIDRVETRRRALIDPARADLTSLPVSEKKIREADDERKESVIFANQLLQLPGITEPIAMGLAQYFGTPLNLMRRLESSDDLDSFTFASKGEQKKPNKRIKNGIRKVFKMKADPTETIK